MSVQITSREQLKEWLEDKPRDWVTIIVYVIEGGDFGERNISRIWTF